MSAQTFAADRYERMPFRRCGESGLHLPAVSLGFWQRLGDTGNEELCRRCCYYAFDHGVTHFDLANNYGTPDGHSEEVIGEILRDMPRDELIVSTKAGFRMWPGPYGDGGSRKYLLASLDASLRRLGLDYVDIFYHHRPDVDTPLEETMAALDQAVRQGKALYAGVSNYPGSGFRDADAICQGHDWAPITIHQQYLNMMERDACRDLLPHTDAAGTGVIAFCPLAQGRLTDRYLDGLPEDSRQGQRGEKGRQWYERQEAAGVWNRLRTCREIARRRGQTLAQMALTWLLHDERITSVLIGVSKVEQLGDDIEAATAAPLSEEELTEIDRALGLEE